ncbi:alkane 1-monooxygenase, partial [Pseudomonas syringae]|nr:alkane 1-monooxygenase [Pseudomonas syringae]
MNQTLAAPTAWADGKRHLWWLGIMPLATPLLSGALAISTGIQQLW